MGCETEYIIKKGDTLNEIAEKFNTTTENILSLNPYLIPENLAVGSKICVISKTPQDVFCPFGSFGYNINKGDTLYLISKKFNTTVETILLANPSLSPDNLPVGKRICIFRNENNLPPCPTRNYYEIRENDTLYLISRIFSVSLSDILRLNPEINPQKLQVGDIICLPLTPFNVEIIITLSQKRLVLYKDGQIFREYLVCTGKSSTPTPQGSFTIINKQLDPGGPYGTRWLGLSKRGYGIHGTNAPQSIGTASSNGCIRMYNEDVETLFSIVSVSTPVKIFP